MSDNDSIKRREVLNHLGDLFTLCSETGSITERDLEVFEKIIKSFSPVPRPMSAEEFGEKWRRLCKSFSQSPCSTCPLYAFGDTCSLPTTQSIAIVDAWTKEHPEERGEE